MHKGQVKLSFIYKAHLIHRATQCALNKSNNANHTSASTEYKYAYHQVCVQSYKGSSAEYTNFTIYKTPWPFRDCGWERKDDSWNDLDYHPPQPPRTLSTPSENLN